MHRWTLPLLLLFSAVAFGKSTYREVVVVEPYLDLHTGPGKGYPVFHAVARDEQVQVLKERTGWYLVREHRGREGWVTEQALLATHELAGGPIQLDVPSLASLTKRRFEGALMLGDFGGASLISASGSYGLTDHLSIGLTLSNALGNISNAEFATLDITHTLFPEWRLSPFVGLGTGYVHVSPQSTRVQQVDDTNQISYAGAGLRLYISRRFMARAEYHFNYTYTNRNQNEETREWKAGFAFFF